MTETRRRSKCRMSKCGMSKGRAAVAVAALAMLFAGRGPASAADPLTEEQIVKALTPITTRSLTLAPVDNSGAADKKLLESVRNPPAHSLTPTKREQTAPPPPLNPTTDIATHLP